MSEIPTKLALQRLDAMSNLVKAERSQEYIRSEMICIGFVHSATGLRLRIVRPRCELCTFVSNLHPPCSKTTIPNSY